MVSLQFLSSLDLFLINFNNAILIKESLRYQYSCITASLNISIFLSHVEVLEYLFFQGSVPEDEKVSRIFKGSFQYNSCLKIVSVDLIVSQYYRYL